MLKLKGSKIFKIWYLGFLFHKLVFWTLPSSDHSNLLKKMLKSETPVIYNFDTKHKKEFCLKLS